jgi:hypothetical protein
MSDVVVRSRGSFVSGTGTTALNLLVVPADNGQSA